MSTTQTSTPPTGPGGPSGTDAAPMPTGAARSGLRRVAAISVSLVGTYAVTSVLGLVFWLVAARRFPIESVGVAGAAVAAMMLLGTLGTCGLGTLLIARLPLTEQGRRRLLARSALAVAAAGGVVLATSVPLVAVHVLGIGALGPIAGTPGLLALFAVGTALVSVSIVLDQAVLVLGSGGLQLERNTVASVVKLAALVGLAATGRTDGMDIFLAWTIGTAVSLPLVAWRTRGGRALADAGPLVDRAVLRGLAGQALSHHSLNTALQAPLQLLPLLVLVGVSAQDNGVFTTALQLTGAVFALPFAISVALFASAVGSERDVVDRMRFTVPASLALSVAANLLLLPLAGPVLSVFGAQYSAEGVDVLRILALAGLPFVVKDHFVALRRVQGRTTQATGVLVVAAAFELAAAAVGMATGGVVGLCAWWLGALVVEALVLGCPLLVAARRTEPAPGPAPAGATAPAPGPDAAPAGPVVPAVPDGPSRAPAASSSTSVGRRLATWLGAGPLVALMSLGLLPIAEAVARSRAAGSGDTTAQALYVGGLALVFVPAAVAVFWPRLRSSTRALVAVTMMMLLQLTRLVVDPVRFVRHDELTHLNGLRVLADSGRLFEENPLLPVTSYYPGLQLATDAVQNLSGLGAHASAVVVLLACRLVLGLAVLLVVARVTGSMRVGAAAVVLYACNLQLLAFNAQFSYQTMALPLAALVVYLVLSLRRDTLTALLPAIAAAWAVAATHHLTTVLLVGALTLWALLQWRLRRARPRRVRPLLVVAAATALGFAAMALNPGNPLGGYLGDIVTGSAEAVQAVLGTGESRPLFENAAGVRTAEWERYAILFSLVVTLVVLLVAVWRARRLLARRSSIVVLLLLIALLYPVIPAGHLTVATAEVGDRTAGFVFFGVAFVVAWWCWQRPAGRLRAATIGAVTGCVFVGSVVLGAGSVVNQLPGAFRVSDDARSADADNLAATAWMAANLPAGSVVYGDRGGGRLAGPYAGLYVVTHIGTGVDASRLLLDPDLTEVDVELVRRAGIRYLVADRRNANGLPNQGVYIESGEFGSDGRTTPVPAAALRKFSDVPGVQAVYDNGSVVVYDLEALDAP